jgi:hypothetical protein
MDALRDLPWPMICIGAFSFVVVITGVIIWQVIQSRMEKELEQNEKSGRGMAPPTQGPMGGVAVMPIQKPEPLYAWACMATALMDQGGSWLDKQPVEAAFMLARDWNVNDRSVMHQCLNQLTQQPPTAWNAVRLFRVAFAGVRAGYLDPNMAWSGIRPVAQRLQQQYPSFEAIWLDYIAGYRVWRQLPPDGSADDQSTKERLENIARLRQQPPRVDYWAQL